MCALSELGDTACAQDQFALMQHAATLADRPAYRVVMLFLRSTRALRQGRLNLAADLCREARDIAEANGLENLADQYWTCLAVAAREQGRIADLLPIADRNCEAQSYSYSARAALCWLHYQAGNVAQAAAHLEHLAAEEFADIKNSSCSMATAALLAEISAELKIVPYAAALYDFLLPFRDRYAIVETAGAPFGSMSRYLGKLAVALSNYGQAVAHFEDAVNSDRKTGERVWTAYSMLEMANSLLLRGAPGDRERAGEILKLAAADGTDLGMHLLGERISKLAVGSAPAAVAAADPRPNSTNSEVISRIPLHKNSNGATMLPALACARLHQMNTGWELSYDGRSFRLKGLRGLTIIAYLLSRPGQSVSTLELACLGKNGEVTAGPNPASDLGPVLDEDAKRAYRTRVQELNEQLEQARAAGNETAALEVEEELCFLTREIARAVGLFGRDRRTGSDSERARVRITNSIKFAIAKIAEHEPALASYLLRTIRTGASCCYVPDSGAEINWDL